MEDTLRRPCKHGRYDQHYAFYDDPDGDGESNRLCPGGEDVVVDYDKAWDLYYDLIEDLDVLTGLKHPNITLLIDTALGI